MSCTSVDISRVKTARALAPVGTNSRPCGQDGLSLGPNVQHLERKRMKKRENN